MSNVRYNAQGKYAVAETLYERSQAIREKLLGPEHTDVASSLNNRALMFTRQVRALKIRISRTILRVQVFRLGALA